MTNEELERLRKKYKELEEMRTEALTLAVRIMMFEQNPIVKDYLESVERYKEYTSDIRNVEKMSDADLALRALNNMDMKNAENIYVYTGTYKNNTPIEAHPDTLFVSRKNLPYDSSLADYSEYRNIESDYSLGISVSQREEFEKENVVLFLPKEISFEDIRSLYLETAIHYDLEKAKETVLVKSNVHNRI